ncbi:hypothetical protein ACUN22_31245 [Streptomyces anulatus]|uniref:hypothetical protein n=1 Tax=Streptomyces anulatus TaxID=1892 RepID=UPI00403DD2A5
MDEGLQVQDSLVFSACGWAVGRSRKPGPGDRGWLDGFDEAVAACERVFLGVGDGDTFGAAQRDWQAEDRLLAGAEQSARTAYEEHTRAAAALDRAEGERRRLLDEAGRALRSADRHHARLQERLRAARERWGPHLPGGEDLDGRTRQEAHELSSPWSDPEFTRARIRLFRRGRTGDRADAGGRAVAGTQSWPVSCRV